MHIKKIFLLTLSLTLSSGLFAAPLVNQNHSTVKLFNARALSWSTSLSLSGPLSLQAGLTQFDIPKLRAQRDGTFPVTSLTNSIAKLNLRAVWNRTANRTSLRYNLQGTDPTGKKYILKSPTSRADQDSTINVLNLIYDPPEDIGTTFTIPGINFPFAGHNISSDVTFEMLAGETENIKNSAVTAYCKINSTTFDYQLDELTVRLGSTDYACRAKKPKVQRYHSRIDYYKTKYRVSLTSLNQELNQSLPDPNAPYATFEPTVESRVSRFFYDTAVGDHGCIPEGEYYAAYCFIENRWKPVRKEIVDYINDHYN